MRWGGLESDRCVAWEAISHTELLHHTVDVGSLLLCERLCLVHGQDELVGEPVTPYIEECGKNKCTDHTGLPADEIADEEEESDKTLR